MSQHSAKPDPLRDGQNIEGRYYVRKKIGDGAFAEVYSAFDVLTMEPVALKLLHNDRRRMAARERRVLHQLGREDHPNVIRLLRYFTAPVPHSDSPLTHILSYPLMAGTLLDAIVADRKANGGKGGLEPTKLAPALRSIVGGMAFLEGHGIVHMDLKPENILRARGPPERLVLADFGNATLNIVNDSPYEAQSSWYRAPEVCLYAKYGPAIDLWSFGCIVYETETGNALFRANRCGHLTYLHVRELGRPPPEYLALAIEDPQHFRRTRDGTIVCTVGAWAKVPRPPRPSPRSPTLRTCKLLEAVLQWMPTARVPATQLLEWGEICTGDSKGLDLESAPEQ